MSQVFKLFSGSEIEAISKAMGDRVTRWLTSWTGDESLSVEVDVQAASDSISLPDCNYRVDYPLESGNMIRVCMSEDFYKAMPSVLVSAVNSVSAQHTAVVAQIIDRAIYDLVRSVTRSLESRPQTSLAIEQKEFEPVSSRAYSGDIYCDVIIGERVFNVFLPNEVVSTLYEYHSTTNSSVPLGHRRDCSLSGDVRLNVEIGTAEIDFGSLLDMQEGDVIRLDSNITDSLIVRTEDGEQVCRAYLGKKGNNKAIKVIL